MKKFGLLLLSVLFIFTTKAAWVDLNTGINDNLTGVVFWGNNATLSGEKGIYYSTTAGNGANSWTRFNVVGNPSDSIKYNNSSFKDLFAYDLHSNYAFSCGYDTVNNRAVILQFEMTSQTYEILYYGNANSALNKIAYSTESSSYYAVGDNELIVSFNLNTNGVVVSSGGSNNYNSISFYDENFTIVTDFFRIDGLDNNPGLTLLGNTYYSSYGFKDVLQMSNTESIAVGNGLYFINSLTSSVTEPYGFDFGPLNARTVYQNAGYTFIGTDHGVFRQSSDFNVEWLHFSGDIQTNDFWVEPGQLDTLYAVGDNGELIYTYYDGGTPYPSIRLEAYGRCAGETPIIDVNKGSGTNCEWFVDGVFTNNYCPFFGAIQNSGNHELKLVVSNFFGSDTAIVNVTMVDTPSINHSFLITDSIFCREGVIDVRLDTTEQNVKYEFIDMDSGQSFGSSNVANGDTLYFSSTLLNESGTYTLRSSSAIAECKIDFTLPISVTVEKTKANFHSGYINAIPGEEVLFYETCTDANNYQWSFASDAAVLSSNSASLSNSFVNAGYPDIELICWSENGCYDTIIGSGPNIYLPPASYDSCWINANYDNDYTGQFDTELAYLSSYSKMNSGYIVTGSSHPGENFISMYGDSVTLDEWGAYLFKFDEHGVIKWKVNTYDVSGQYSSMKYSGVDSDQNIYTVGNSNVAQKYVDNRGDSIEVVEGTKAIILKLDSMGNTIWRRTYDNIYVSRLYIDQSDNIYVFDGGTGTSYLNDTLANVLDGGGLSKISKDGELEWSISIDVGYIGNYPVVEDITFDGMDNMYVTGNFRGGTGGTVYATDNITGISIEPFDDANASESCLYLLKINSDGGVEWVVRSRTTDSPWNTTRAHDVFTDDDGNSYISGINGCQGNSPLSAQLVMNADGTVTSSNIGRFMLMKVNSAGVCEYISGAYNDYYPGGTKIDVVNDTIYFLGHMVGGYDVDFLNDDGSYINTHVNGTDYFIAIYDLEGNVHRVISNGDNVYQVENFHDFFGFEKLDGNQYQLARNIKFHTIGQADYIDFGTALIVEDEGIGLVSTFQENCGNLAYLSYDFIDSVHICSNQSFTFPDGLIVSNLDHVYSHTSSFTSQTGTDSTIKIVLIPTVLDTSIEADGLTLISNQFESSNILFQWLDCNDGYNQIVNETNQSYDVLTNGSYAVLMEIDGTTCADTSECVTIDFIGLDSEESSREIKFYPNPVQNTLNLSFPDDADRVIEIFSLSGELVVKYDGVSNANSRINVAQLSKGMYVLNVVGSANYRLRFVKL